MRVLADSSLDNLVRELEALLIAYPEAPRWWRSALQQTIYDAQELELRYQRLTVNGWEERSEDDGEEEAEG